MTPGPTRIPERILRAGHTVLHHRTPEFSAALAELLELARPLFGTKEADLLPVHATGRAAMEGAIVNFFRPLFKRGETFLQEGMASGDFKQHSPRQLLISIYGMTMSYFADAEFIRLLYDEDPTSQTMLEERLAACLDIIFHTLGCDRPTRSAT